MTSKKISFKNTNVLLTEVLLININNLRSYTYNLVDHFFSFQEVVHVVVQRNHVQRYVPIILCLHATELKFATRSLRDFFDSLPSPPNNFSNGKLRHDQNLQQTAVIGFNVLFERRKKQCWRRYSLKLVNLCRLQGIRKNSECFKLHETNCVKLNLTQSEAFEAIAPIERLLDLPRRSSVLLKVGDLPLKSSTLL